MDILIMLNGEVFREYHISKRYLRYYKFLTPEQNYNARKKIIDLHIQLITYENNFLFRKYEDVQIVLSFESKMNDPGFVIRENPSNVKPFVNPLKQTA